MLLLIEILSILWIFRSIYLSAFTSRGLVKLSKVQGVALLVVLFLLMPMLFKALLVVLAVAVLFVKINRQKIKIIIQNIKKKI